MSRTLIKGGWVLSLDSRVGNHVDAEVLIEDGRISEVGKDLRVRGAEIVDASNAIVMPGFVDAHRHVAESLFRASGDLVDGPTLVAHLAPDDVYAATLIGLLGAAEAGVTTVLDWMDLEGAALEAALQAHDDAGLRTVVVPAARETQQGGTDRPLRTWGVAASLDPADLERARVLAKPGSRRIHSHAVGAGRVSAAAAALGADVTLVHCSGLDETDFDTIAAKGTGVVLTPSSEMAGGMEPPRVQSLIDRNVTPGLGVDSERMAPGDIFAPMRATISLQHATHFDLKLAGKGGLPNLLTTREVLRYATVGGARAIGLEQVTGSLTPGKEADVIVLDTDRPNIHPINDPIGAVVWGMDTSNLAWVFVAGKTLMRDGELQGDLERARRLAVEARDRVANAAGLAVGAGGGSP
jgi:5-methylthioadenosine/S-adenosylhomocysteine deaminase